MPRDRYDEDDDDRPRRRRRDEDDEDDLPRRRRDDDEEDDDRPRRSRRRRDDDDRPAAAQGSGMAVAALVLGLLSICFGPITGIIGGILGVMGMSKPSGKGMAVAGLILSGLFSLTWVGVVIWGFTEGKKQLEATAAKKQATDSLKVLGIASHSYHDAQGKLPKAYHDDFRNEPVSDPTTRLSWRVSLLPYIEQDNLFRQIRPEQPWNGPANLPLSTTAIKTYSDTDTPTDPNTRLRCFYDNGAAFDLRSASRIPASFPDGTSNTILYVEGGDKVTWSRFQEYKFDPTGPLPQLGRPDRDTFMVVMADGSVKVVRKSISESTLKNAINRQDGMVLGPDW